MTRQAAKRQFQETVQEYYVRGARTDLPWRQPDNSGHFDPYHILVSEIMLQQTQVNRVVEKYRQFLAVFPTINSLADAELGDVLRMWSGLGYNRRAKFLHQAARMIVKGYDGAVPNTLEDLISLPGIGKNTAGAILAYAFNQPALFIETNIRTVYIHHFFSDQKDVDDTNIINMLSITLDTDNPREWYWALMDYGTYLKKSGVRRNQQSKHYALQSTFTGSKRQVRGAVLKQLTVGQCTLSELSTHIKDERLTTVIEDLLTEGLIQKHDNILTL